MFTELDWAYIAGFFDGDGSVSISRLRDATKVRKVGYQAQVLLAQNPPCPLLSELLHEFGGKIYKNGRACNSLMWRCPARNHIKFLEKLLPYLRLKKDAAEIAIEYQRRVDKNPNSRPLTDAEWGARTALYERMQDTFDKRGVSMHARGRRRRGS